MEASSGLKWNEFGPQDPWVSVLSPETLGAGEGGTSHPPRDSPCTGELLAFSSCCRENNYFLEMETHFLQELIKTKAI